MNQLPPSPPADWYPDPTGRHQHRYWDGTNWTDTAASNGAAVHDPLVPLQRPFEARVSAASAAVVAATEEEPRKRRLFGRRPAPASTRERQPTAARAPYPLAGGSGRPGVEVEAEFAYMEAIHAALGRAPRLDEEMVLEDLTATLVPEPDNPHDANAVAVQLGGRTAGYLGRDDAREYQPVLMDLVRAGFAPTARANLWAIARKDYDKPRKPRFFANLRLALKDPHLLIPVNDPPEAASSLLPWGNALQLTGEEKYQGTLARYVSPAGDGLALGTLHVTVGGTAKSPKDVIEVRIDGQPVGTLSAASSVHFAPVVQHLASGGVLALAWLRLKGNAVSTQVTLQATKSHELPQQWFAELSTIPRLRQR